MSFQKKVLICIVSSLLLGAIYYYYTKFTFPTSPIKILIDIDVNTKDSLTNKRLDLYINNGDVPVKIENPKIEINNNKFEYVFEITNQYDLKIIRLDFENFKVSDVIRINKLEILKGSGKPILSLKHNSIVKNLYSYSNSIGVTDKTIYFTDSNPVFDPFILFNLKSLLFYNIPLQLILLLPWCIMFILPVYYWICEKFKDKNFETIIVSMFIIVLPLKIAWLTFITLMLLLTSLIRFIFYSKRVLSINSNYIIFFSLFLLYIVFGQVKGTSVISLQLAFILIPSIFLFNNKLISLFAFYEIYIRIFAVLMAIIIINGLIFIFSLNEYYDMPALSYFMPENTKLLNQKMMWWLPYSHPTFLSSFFLVGLLFCRSLYLNKLINKNLFILYFILSFFAIVLLGSRAMLIMLAVFVLYFLLFLNKEKQGIIFLFITSVTFVLGLMLCIESIDPNRSWLWNMSYNAISENFYGYGVGSSKEILNNPSFYLIDGHNFPPTENHSHNQFITIFLELGMVALFIFSFIISYLGYVLYKKTDKAFISIYFLFFVILFTESLFKTATPLYFYTFIFCLSFVDNKKHDKLKLKLD